MAFSFAAVYAMVKKIPKGKVASYGQIAALVGSPKAARQVGWALHQLDSHSELNIPWQRVVNRHGEISTTCLDHSSDEQAYLLKKEGVAVEQHKGVWKIDMQTFCWKTGKS